MIYRDSRLYQIVLCTHLLTLPLLTHGLKCFVCHDKKDDGCTNSKLKAGHTKARYSQDCPGSKAVCVKLTTEVEDYYENMFDGKKMDEYYKSMDKFNECAGITTPSEGHPTKAMAVSGATVAAGGATAAAGGANGTTALPLVTVASGRMAEEPRREVNRSGPGIKKCQSMLPFPEPTTSEEREETRNTYACGNYSDYKAINVVGRCRKSSDSIVTQFLCTCDKDLCNAAPAAMPTAFVLLLAALLHLHLSIG